MRALAAHLYGKTHADPVMVTINAQPDKGLLGQLGIRQPAG
jgi:hypothetical protein